ncbi:cyclase family protein [candidate division WWE3 bacterium]|nr:cyclase family protein [candidate division WWE3 bacterium]
MGVYPGDPKVEITDIHFLDKEGWRLKKLSFSSHIGTHVNIPYHMVENGETLDTVSLDKFIGKTFIYKEGLRWSSDEGILFRGQNIDTEVYENLIKTPPKFVGLSASFEFDIELEKKLLENDIISFENLVNLEKLPDEFIFYGAPLFIDQGDGSPVRAFAVVV